MLVECKCGKRYRIKEELRGQRVKCQNCGGKMRVPSATPPVSPTRRNVDAVMSEDVMPEERRQETEPEAEIDPGVKLALSVLFACGGLLVTGLGLAGVDTGDDLPPEGVVVVGLIMTFVIPPLWYFYGSVDYSKWD